MDNKQAKYYLKQLPKIKKRLAENKKRAESIRSRIYRDERIVRKLDYDGAADIELFKGQLLLIWDSGSGCDIEGIADDNFRHADVCLNAHNKTTFGGNLKIYGTGYGKEELFLGSNWESREELLNVCKDFVALATIPKHNKDWLYSKFVKAVKKFMEKE